MLIIFFDTLNTILQSFIIVYCCSEILSKKSKLSKIKFSIVTLIIFLVFEWLTYSGMNSTQANILMLILCFIILSVAIKKIDVALVGFGLGYFIITMTTYIIGNLYNGALINIKMPISSNLKTVLLFYTPIILMYIPIYIYRKHLLNLGDKLINIKNSIAIGIIIDISLILFNTIYTDWFYGKLNSILRSILYGSIFFCFILSAIYFSKIYSKAKEIEILNNALEEKITELRKIKHDYGSQISTLFFLAQSKNIDKITEILQGVIKQHDEVSSTIEITNTSSPILIALLKNANSLGINTIIDNEISIEKDLNINILDFTQILSNIINNAVRFVKGKKDGYIKITTKKEEGYCCIIVENNGEMISKKYINEIFKQGYTTKDEKIQEHGFGLFICKQKVEENNGEITVESNEEATRFIIKLPIN